MLHSEVIPQEHLRAFNHISGIILNLAYLWNEIFYNKHFKLPYCLQFIFLSNVG